MDFQNMIQNLSENEEMRAILRKYVIEQKHWNERQKIRQNISTWVSKDVYQAAEHCHYYFFIIINLFDLWPKYEFLWDFSKFSLKKQLFVFNWLNN